MDPVTIIILVAVALIALALIWWYYPYFRRPWMPKLGLLKGKRAARWRGRRPILSATNPSLVISKARCEMELYDGEKLLKTYRIALGLNPLDDKRKEGDGCTPEGEFYICTKNDRSRFHLFLGLSYPSEEDAERGLNAGLISKEEHDRILEALTDRRRPPWDTRLGGEIGIHGGGSESHWTQGGIAIENRDIEELFLIVDIGTPVTILP
jgi:murein L,D-transpeptidase YafK